MSTAAASPTEMSKTALLLGYTGRILEYIENLLSEKGISSERIGEEKLRDYDFCQEISESLFQAKKITYIVYSVLVPRGVLPDRIADMDTRQWLRFKQLAFTNLFNVNRTFVKGMSESGGGRYLTVGSITGVVPARGEQINGAVSASAFMMMQSNVLELARKGITANAAALGLSGDNETLSRHIPGGKAIGELDTAACIVQILTDTPEDMAGAVVPLDAGFSCGFMRDW